MHQDSQSASYPYRYRLTRLGLHFVFVAAFTMVGGSLRGFNLLLVLAGLLVGALLVQWRCSRWALRSSAVSRYLPCEAFADVPFRIRYQVTNLSRSLPLWMIRIDDPIESTAGEIETAAGCGVGVVGPGQSAGIHYECVVSTRGKYQLGPLSVSTWYPISLGHARKMIDQPGALHVYPGLLRLRKGWQQTLLTKQGGAAAAARRSGPNEGEFFGLREWQTGDCPKWIHHRTTARVGEPIVRQFERQRQFDACLLIDCFDAGGRHSGGAGQRSGGSEAVETAISFAATVVMSMDHSPANRLVLAVADDNPMAIAGGRVQAGKRRMLELLSAATSTPSPNLLAGMEQAIHVAGHAKDLIVISSRDMQDALQGDVSAGLLASHLGSWARRGALRWINVRSADFQSWVIGPANRSATPGANGREPRSSPADGSVQEQQHVHVA